MKIWKILLIGFLGYSSLAQSAVSEADKALGRRLKKAQDKGLLLLQGTARAEDQVNKLIAQGYLMVGDKQVNISGNLHKFLNAVLTDAEAQNRTFGILSLAGSRGPHGANANNLVMAVDLSLFSNYSMRIDKYAGVLLGVEHLLTMLPVGPKYKIGLPRTAYQVDETERTCRGSKLPIDGNACDRKTYAARIAADVFDNPETYDVFLGAEYNERFPVTHANKGATEDLAFIKKDEYRERLTEATEAAAARGVKFTGWMADSLDHLHIGVDPDATRLP